MLAAGVERYDQVAVTDITFQLSLPFTNLFTCICEANYSAAAHLYTILSSLLLLPITIERCLILCHYYWLSIALL